MLQPYEERAAEDKKRYEREMAEYPDSDPEEPVKKKKKKDPNAPRKNLNAWMFFVQQVRPTVVAELGEEGKRVATVTKAVSERWSKMSPEEKLVRSLALSRLSERQVAPYIFFLCFPLPSHPLILTLLCI